MVKHMEILQTFGVEWGKLIAQIVNFVLVLVLLRIILYKPIITMLEDRKKRIAESMTQAQTIEERFAKLEDEQAKIRKEAQEQAAAIIAEAKASGKSVADEITAQARSQAEALLTKAQVQNAAEYEKMRSELRKEVAQLAVVAAQKAVAEVLTNEQKQKITENAAKEILS